MKKFLLTFALIVLSVVTFAATFDLGVKFGYNTTKLTSDLSTFSANSQGGYNFGAFGRFGGSKLYLQPEFLYVVKNGGFKIGSATNAIKMHAIQVPLLLGYKILNLKVASIRAFTGPAVSFASGYKSDQPLTGNLKSSTWAYQLGAGVDFLMFIVDLRYELGLSKQLETSTYTNKANTFSVSFGFKFL
jgi:hypothetical protein